MRALRAAAFVLVEGMRMYLAASRGTPGDLGDLRGRGRPVGVELVRGVKSGRL